VLGIVVLKVRTLVYCTNLHKSGLQNQGTFLASVVIVVKDT